MGCETSLWDKLWNKIGIAASLGRFQGPGGCKKLLDRVTRCQNIDLRRPQSQLKACTLGLFSTSATSPQTQNNYTIKQSKKKSGDLIKISNDNRGWWPNKVSKMKNQNLNFSWIKVRLVRLTLTIDRLKNHLTAKERRRRSWWRQYGKKSDRFLDQRLA